MARRRRTRQVKRMPGRPFPSDRVWKVYDETRPQPLKRFTNEEANVPWHQELLAPSTVVKYNDRVQVLPDEYSSLYKARLQQAKYRNYTHRTAYLNYGVKRHHLYRNLKARDVIYPKGSDLDRIY